jgi:pyridoxamine 5'-phosphate oxidase
MPNASSNDFLPEPLPTDPLGLFTEWFAHARGHSRQPNPDAMVLATVGPAGKPAARVVLCKQLVAPAGYVVFFTNYHSRKGRELTAHPQAAGVLHWDGLHRQVRIEGPLLQSPAEESDRYFALRPLESRLGAWASQQSEPLASRATLQDQLQAVKERFAIGTAMETPVTRPSHWGGLRLWIERLELWVEGPGRIHDRAVWERTLQAAGPYEFGGTEWLATRLNP